MTVINKSNERIERKDISEALTTNEANITTNATNIATNTTNISSNDTDIAALDTRITTLEGGVNGTPPTSLLGRATANADLQTSISSVKGAEQFSASSSTYNVWTTAATQAATNPGVITFLNIVQTANASNLDAGARLTVDGVEVWTTDNDFWQVATDNLDGTGLVGGEIAGDGSFNALPFAVSWLLEFRINENSAGTVTVRTNARWHI